MSLCTVSDDFVNNKPHFIVKLSDGTIVCGDDERPGQRPASAWVRLGSHLKEKGLSIVEYSLVYQDYVARLPSNAEAYYFAKGIGADVNTQTSISYLIAGSMKDGIWECSHFATPHLEKIYQSLKKFSEAKPPCLISNPIDKPALA